MGFSLRRKAITIPATDLIIAASAIRAGAVLYHVDGHYDMLSRYYGLKAKNLGA
jgi:predicted nucleic acid-binding protein